jgi:serine/threonine protein kinase
MSTPSFNQEALPLQEKLAGEELDFADCLAVDPAIGCVIGQQFELVERIGEGGMSTVYRARDLQLGREVAIKLLTQTKTRDAASLARFKQEALAVSRLDHQNVVRLYQYGMDGDGRPYLAMDLIEGQSLAQLIQEHHQFSFTDCLSILDQILSALVHAHGLGIVHRYIKPSNIMIGFDQNKKPTVKVVDFGIAKMAAVADSPALTRTGDMFGSPFYMSPEQCLGNEIDERSDVYSAGCLLYELIEGHPPYQASNTLKVLHMHISERPSQLTRADIDHSCRTALDRIIAKSMARDPRMRFAGAQLMKDELAQVACGKFKRSAGLFRRGHSGALALICCLLVPAMCGLGMYYYLS